MFFVDVFVVVVVVDVFVAVVVAFAVIVVIVFYCRYCSFLTVSFEQGWL